MSHEGWTEVPAEASSDHSDWTEAPVHLFTGKEERAAEDKALLDSMGNVGKFVAGGGYGFLNTGKNILNLASKLGGLSFVAPDRAKWAKDDQEAAGLLDTGAGGFGKLAAEIGSTLPIGGLAGAGLKGAAMRGLPMLARAAPALVGAAKFAPEIASALGMVGEGAAQGAVLAGPDNEGKGALLGGGLGGAGALLGKGAGLIAEKQGPRIANILEKAKGLALAAEQKTTQLARSEAGQAAQAAYRTLEHLKELRSYVPPTATEKLAALDGQIAKLSSDLAEKSVEKLPGDIARKEATSAAYSDAVSSEGARAEEKAAELAKSSLGKDAWQLFRMYGEPFVGAGLGSWLGSKTGSPYLGGGLGLAGSLIMGRTRAGKAIANRWAKPGNQLAIARGLQTLMGGASKTLGNEVTEDAIVNALTPRGHVTPWASNPAIAEDDANKQGALAQLLRGSNNVSQ